MHALVPTPETLRLTEFLQCLADPIRLQIISELGETDDLECGTFRVPVTKSTLSHHYRILREAGVIATTKAGARSLNRLRRTELDSAFPGLLDAVLLSAREVHP